VGQGLPAAKSEQPLPPAKAEPEVVKPAVPPREFPRIERRPTTEHTGGPQEVMFTSSPGGALATLDGNSSMVCTTPCSLTAAQGRHTVVLIMPGYEIVRRDFTVGAAPLELTPIALTVAAGTLMLTSVPDGAAISVNGKRIDKVTPAVISLGLGTYSIMVEKGGKQATEQVEIKHGITSRRLTLGQ
jgi:PEGA domain